MRRDVPNLSRAGGDDVMSPWAKVKRTLHQIAVDTIAQSRALSAAGAIRDGRSLDEQRLIIERRLAPFRWIAERTAPAPDVKHDYEIQEDS